MIIISCESRGAIILTIKPPLRISTPTLWNFISSFLQPTKKKKKKIHIHPTCSNHDHVLPRPLRIIISPSLSSSAPRLLLPTIILLTKPTIIILELEDQTQKKEKEEREGLEDEDGFTQEEETLPSHHFQSVLNEGSSSSSSLDFDASFFSSLGELKRYGPIDCLLDQNKSRQLIA